MDRDDPNEYDEVDEEGEEDDEERSEPEVTIEVSGLSLFTHVGVTAAEREVGQRLLLDLRLDVGDRRAHLQAAVAELPGHGVTVLASSSVYETEPVGLVLDQRNFYNACLRVQTEHGPEELLAACKAVERVVGREPGGVRHGPRVIDVDLLLLADT